MSSLKDTTERLREILTDPVKAEALLDLVVNSENKQVQKAVINAWMTIILTMGEEIEEVFNEIDIDHSHTKNEELDNYMQDMLNNFIRQSTRYQPDRDSSWVELMSRKEQ